MLAIGRTHLSFEFRSVGRFVLGAERRYLEAQGDGSHPIRRQVGRPNRLGKAATGDIKYTLGLNDKPDSGRGGGPPGPPARQQHTGPGPA